MTPKIPEIEEYKTKFNSKIEEKDFNKLYDHAISKINKLTFNRIVAKGFNNLTTFQQEKIRLALLYQIEYLEENGLEEDNVSSYSVLDISINKDNSKETEASKLHMSSLAYDYLQETGLCTRSHR